jgi:uncharacterized lipoprotein YajG
MYLFGVVHLQKQNEMKKPVSLLAAVILLSLSSCYKEFQCTCEDPNATASTMETFTVGYNGISEERALKKCKADRGGSNPEFCRIVP